jgi:hypothetical protein
VLESSDSRNRHTIARTVEDGGYRTDVQLGEMWKVMDALAVYFSVVTV